MGAYVTCLDCGKEFAYNWDEMRLEEPIALSSVPDPLGPVARPEHSLSRILRLGS